jgi:hypothetical protein
VPRQAPLRDAKGKSAATQGESAAQCAPKPPAVHLLVHLQKRKEAPEARRSPGERLKRPDRVGIAYNLSVPM